MSKFKLANVRLSFPALFTKAFFDGKETKYEATLLIDKDKQAKLVDQIQGKIDAFIDQQFPAGAPKALKITCFQDGDTKDYDGYANHMALKGTSNSRITIIDRDKTPIVEADGKPYAGCYVNAICSLWYSNHVRGGHQILANLHGVQFYKDGTPFGEGATDVTSEFDSFEDEDGDEFDI